MSRASQRDRDEFIAIMTKEGVPLDVARALLRAEATLHRLAEAECNGDDWHDPRGPRHFVAPGPGHSMTACGERIDGDKIRWTNLRSMTTCSSCKSSLVEARVRELVKTHRLEPVFSGDPRGAVLIVKVPSGKTNDWGQRGVVVP